MAQSLDRQAKSVESAMAGLAAVAARTTGLVDQMKGSTEQAQSAVSQVSMIGQANAASAEEGAASAGHLSGAADGLRKLVGQFKV